MPQKVVQLSVADNLCRLARDFQKRRSRDVLCHT